MGRYKEIIKEEARHKKSKDEFEYFQKLEEVSPFKIEEINSEIKHISKICKINNKIFVFCLTSSKYSVEINNNYKFWKVRSQDFGATKNPRRKKNPILYVPKLFLKSFSKTSEKVFYVYPVKIPYNNAYYDKNKYFVGSFEKSIEYVIETALKKDK